MVDPASAILGGVVVWLIKKDGTKLPQPLAIDWNKLLDILTTQKPTLYVTKTIDVANAYELEETKVQGNHIEIENYGATVPVYMRLNEIEAEAIDITTLKSIEGPFYRYFITNDAGAGEIRLKIGKGMKFEGAEDLNLDSFVSGSKAITAAGTAEQLDDVAIPHGYQVTIIAAPGNTGIVFLGNSQANAQSATARFNGLDAGMAVSLRITNLNLVFADVSVSGETVSWIVEQQA